MKGLRFTPGRPLHFLPRAVALALLVCSLCGLAPSSEWKSQKPDLPPVGLAFYIADVKWTPQGMKILELGAGLHAGFLGYDILHPGEEMITLLWKYLREDLGLPMWYVSEKRDAGGAEDFHLLSRFSKLPACRMGELALLETALQTGAFGKARPDFNPEDISTYSGVVLAPATQTLGATAQLLRNHPHVLLLNEKAFLEQAVDDKYRVAGFFDESLRAYRPRALLKARLYRPDLATEIQKQMPSDAYVVKPLDAYGGQGVLPVAGGADLEALLKKILPPNPETLLHQKRHKDRLEFMSDPYKYWSNDPNPGFLIESLERSTPVLVDGKPFDGTLRVVFVLLRAGEKVTAKVLGMYWKLPVAPVGEGSLRAAVVSNISADRVSSGAVDPAVGAAVREKTEEVMPRLYQRMIGQDTDAWIDKLLFSNDEAEVVLGLYQIGDQGPISPQRWARLIQLARMRNPLYDVFLTRLLSKLFHYGSAAEMVPLDVILLHSSVPEVRERSLEFAMMTAESHPEVVQAALRAGESVSRGIRPSVRIEFLSLLHAKGRISAEELLAYYEAMFAGGDNGTQWMITDDLLAKGLMPRAAWFWASIKPPGAHRLAAGILVNSDLIIPGFDPRKKSNFSLFVQSLAADEGLAVQFLEASVSSEDEVLLQAFETVILKLAERGASKKLRRLAERLQSRDPKEMRDTDSRIRGLPKAVSEYFRNAPETVAPSSPVDVSL